MINEDELRTDDPDFEFWFMRFSRSVGSLKSETRRADDAGVVAEMGLHDLDAARRDLSCAGNLLTPGAGKELEVFLTNAAAENDTLRQDGVQQRPGSGGCRVHRALHDGGRSRIARRSGKYGAAVVEAKRLCRRGDRRARREGFPATARAAVAFRAVGQHGKVAQFGMFPVHAAINLSIQEDRTTDASAERHHHERIRIASGAELELAEGCGIRVVFEANRDTK